jgi:NAD(P)-dependent dehydrogenase (short-subunit alcohol dehydrogenase family)
MLSNINFKENFNNKKILITGASTGLGLACVKQYLDLGAIVYGTSYTNTKNLIKIKKKYNNKFNFFEADFNDISNVKILYAEYRKKYKNIDIIIHALGGGFGLTSETLSHNDFLKLFNLNIGVSAEINRLFIGLFDKKGGNIMHVGSTASVQAIGSIGYNTMKTGLRAYVKTFARKMLHKKIVVNSILPGAFIAPLNHFDRKRKVNKNDFYKFQNKIISKKILSYKELMPMILLITSKYGIMTAGSNILIDNSETDAI